MSPTDIQSRFAALLSASSECIQFAPFITDDSQTNISVLIQNACDQKGVCIVIGDVIGRSSAEIPFPGGTAVVRCTVWMEVYENLQVPHTPSSVALSDAVIRALIQDKAVVSFDTHAPRIEQGGIVTEFLIEAIATIS